MASASQARTQFFTKNISVSSGAVYDLTFKAKTTAAMNISRISCFGMDPPYPHYAQDTRSLQLEPSDDWRAYSVRFFATVTAKDARITWCDIGNLLLFKTAGSEP
eukprot:g2117.t1